MNFYNFKQHEHNSRCSLTPFHNSGLSIGYSKYLVSHFESIYRKYDRKVSDGENFLIATLEPETSSHFVANELLRPFLGDEADQHIKLCESFEVAAENVSSGTADFLLVPHAYPGISKFHMDRGLAQVDVTAINTLTYSLAGTQKTLPDDGPITIVSHPAPVSLVDYVPALKDREIIFESARSTTAAAENANLYPQKFCISNPKPIDRLNLEIIADLGPIAMSWTLFKRMEA